MRIKLCRKTVRVDGTLRLAQDKLRECLPAEALAKAGETSLLGSYGALYRGERGEKCGSIMPVCDGSVTLFVANI
jgi:hypothetical protein